MEKSCCDCADDHTEQQRSGADDSDSALAANSPCGEGLEEGGMVVLDDDVDTIEVGLHVVFLSAGDLLRGVGLASR